MRRRGFAVEKRFTFWRKRGPLYDMLISQILTGGELLRIHVTIWSPWVDNSDGDLGIFPPKSWLIGGTLSDEFPETMHGGQLFEIGRAQQLESTFPELLTLIDRHALPWFNSVSSYESYVSYVGDKGFYPTSDEEQRIKEGIRRGFAKEPITMG